MKWRILMLVLSVMGSPALAQNGANPRETLNQHIADLRQNPDDNGLRAQIIRSALALDPQPLIPEEARRHFVRAVTIQKDARNETDAELAAREYREALLLAPWWGDAYFNLGVAAQTANLFDEAIHAFRLYLLTQPSPDDARDAQDRIYAVEAKKDLVLRSENDRRDEEARELRNREARNRETLQRLVGQWRVMLPLASGRHLLDECEYHSFEVQGNEMVVTAVHTPYNNPQNCGRQRNPREYFRFTVDGEKIIARISPSLVPGGAVASGTVDFNEFKVYAANNLRWEFYREGTYPVRRPGEY